MNCLNFAFRPSNVDLSTSFSARSPDGSPLAARNPLTDISNAIHYSPSKATANGTSMDRSSSSRSHPTFHPGRVVTVDCHDIDAWAQERKACDTKHHPVAASSSVGPNGAIADDCFPVDVVKSDFALMELPTHGLGVAEQFSNAAWLREDTLVPRSHKWTSLASSGLDVPLIRPKVTTSSRSPKDLSEGRRRVGEILVRCGVIDVSGLSPMPTAASYGNTSDSHSIDTPVVSSGTFRLPSEDNEVLVAALANWTSEWVHTLVIQPYQGAFRFQFQGMPNRASASIAPRIRRILSGVYNPVHVAIHALWFIGTLTGNDTQSNAPFLSVPIFRYLHNNGTCVAEEFMFRTFVACSMIGDKTVNDATLSTSTWNRLTRIPQVMLNATEKDALKCLKWNVMMTGNQWQETIVYLRSCIKVGSSFDPFAYDETSSSSIMARYLDGLISLSHVNEQEAPPSVEILAPQPVRHSTHWEVFDVPEWCPEVDPIINQKPRSVGIAPGSDRNLDALKVGMTAKDLLDSILGSSKVPNLGHLARPAGTSFCGSFGAIGARFAQTVKMASTCQSTSWFPSHGSFMIRQRHTELGFRSR